jgi:Flp pilus assembly pilin Flp
MRFMQFVRQFHREESGQDMLEYGLVIVAVVTAVLAGSASLTANLATDMAAVNAKIVAAIGL